MSTKGLALTKVTRQKISKRKKIDRTETLEKLMEYIQTITTNNPDNRCPSIVSASLYAGISKKALLNWELTTAEGSEVREILDFIRDLEEDYLRTNGLNGTADSKLTQLILKSDYGLQEKPAQLTQNNTFNGISPELLAEALELSRSKNLKLD